MSLGVTFTLETHKHQKTEWEQDKRQIYAINAIFQRLSPCQNDATYHDFIFNFRWATTTVCFPVIVESESFLFRWIVCFQVVLSLSRKLATISFKFPSDGKSASTLWTSIRLACMMLWFHFYQCKWYNIHHIGPHVYFHFKGSWFPISVRIVPVIIESRQNYTTSHTDTGTNSLSAMLIQFMTNEPPGRRKFLYKLTKKGHLCLLRHFKKNKRAFFKVLPKERLETVLLHRNYI